MHQVTYDMVKFRIDEELRYAARQRQARAAISNRPRAIDFAGIGQKLRQRLFGGFGGFGGFGDAGGRPTAVAGA